MDNKFIVSAAPHIKRNFSVFTQNLFIIVALIPSIVFASLFHGLSALLILIMSTVSCYIFDSGLSYMVFGKYDHRDISSVITGVMLGLCMPVNINIGYVILAAFFSIFVAKILFGGQGKALVHEATLGVAVIAALLGAFSTSLCTVIVEGGTDIVSPLTYFMEGNYTAIPILSLFLGNGGGLIGSASSIAAIIGGIVLCITMVYDFYIPILAIISFVVTIILTKGTAAFVPEVFAGSFLFVTCFMLPAHSSSPTIWISKSFYAILFGVLVALTRTTYIMGEAGVFYCLLLCNLVTPILDSLFGYLYRGRGVKRYE